MNNLRIAALTVVLLAAPLARADTPRVQVEHTLSGDEARIDEASLKALGAGWEQALESLALDPHALPILRVRAGARSLRALFLHSALDGSAPPRRSRPDCTVY